MKLFILTREIDGVPSEFQLLPYGETTYNDRPGKAVLDEVAMKNVIARFEERGTDMVIDYEHQTLTGQEAPAAGWIKKLVDRGREGLWAVVEWTDRAKEYLKKKEYRYYSPVMWTSKTTHRVEIIEHVALTNYPATKNLRPIMAKMESAFAGSGHDHNEEDESMNKIKEMLKLAGAPATVEPEEGVALVVLKCADLTTQLAAEIARADSAEKIVACKEVLDALGADEKATSGDLVKVIAGMKALETPAQKLSQKVQELEARISDRDRDDLVKEALKDGKTSPAELEEWGNDLAKNAPDQFRKIVLSRQPGSVVPLDKIKHGDKKPGAILDDAQKEINKQLEISDETFQKYGPKPAE